MLPLLPLAGLLCLAAAQPAWNTIAPLPFARSDHTATALGSAIYIAGGCDGAQKCANGMCSCTSTTRNMLAYSPATNAYTARAPLLQPRYRHIVCPLADESGMVLLGGRTLTPANATTNDAIITAVDVYRPASNSWATLGVAYPADLGSDNSCTTALSGVIYVMGGYDTFYSVATTVMYAFTLGGSGGGAFAKVAAMPMALGDFSSTLAPTGNIHVLGGFTTDPDEWWCRPTTSHFVYNPTLNTWDNSTIPPMPVGLGQKDDAIVLSGRLFTIGGETKSKTSGCTDLDIVALTKVFSYDPLAKTWRNETFLPSPIIRTAGAALGGIAYLFGGQGPIIDSGDTIPILFTAYSYMFAPPPAPAPAPLVYSPGAFGGAIAGTLVVACLLAACAARLCGAFQRPSASAKDTVLHSAA